MILVNTSVWVDHLRTGVPRLTELLEGLPSVTQAAQREVLMLIERHPLAAPGNG